jgi:hypothetical protein
MIWIVRHPAFHPDMLGFIPSFLDDLDPRPAREQFDANYRFGGGWISAPAAILPDDTMTYPGDPPYPVLAECRLRHERILFYPYEFVAIVQPDGSFVVQRMG